MRKLLFALCGVLLMLPVLTTAHAEDSSHKASRLTEYEKTSPPTGFVDFCTRLPNDPNCKTQPQKATAPEQMTATLWETLDQVNTSVNERIHFVTDKELYRVNDYWAYPLDAGDCEDYVLLKQRTLLGLGFSLHNLLITEVYNERVEDHVILTVVTSEGEFVLDNRRADILPSNQTGYTYLKRQSQTSPRRWRALYDMKKALEEHFASK